MMESLCDHVPPALAPDFVTRLRQHIGEAQDLLGEDGYTPPLRDLDAASGHLADALNILDDLAPNERSTGMTWTINISGHDNATGEEKERIEQELVARAKELVAGLDDLVEEGLVYTTGQVTTNTTGSVALTR